MADDDYVIERDVRCNSSIGKPCPWLPKGKSMMGARQQLSQVQQLPKQGELIRTMSSETAAVWAKAVQALLSNTMKFALSDSPT